MAALSINCFYRKNDFQQMLENLGIKDQSLSRVLFFLLFLLPVTVICVIIAPLIVALVSILFERALRRIART